MKKRVFFIAIESILDGWAEIIFALGLRERLIRASYTPSDSLERLVDSALLALSGRGSEIVFSLEPEFVSVFTNFDRSPGEIEIGDTAITVTAAEYARNVLLCFDRYRHKYSEDIYAKEWRYDFPRDKLESLRELLRCGKNTAV